MHGAATTLQNVDVKYSISFSF